MTVTRMATPRGPIPVTVDTFEASGHPGRDTKGGGGVVGTRSADAYRGYLGDRKGLYKGYIGLHPKH